ncbi:MULTISPECIES: TIM barrel protein [unclassified Rhizobium]|uniref:TIM barrel protein n=1 Tax=unclassified Rhizobium TaxID=2613769 RepID=UPI0016115BAD|nr:MULTISPECIES: TIM barrel protein [unclassified Rhizobium]MBB3318119.1 2-keto-myo-inositol isomerase [Rhizobium sp. BK181]MCS3742938.1 2-keto-myo-inositol isomerase [Rhizobium sp. BK661]MCS4095594.1 2-keto-myo-inositol isomerase [Rhizobium sp. BK176]
MAQLHFALNHMVAPQLSVQDFFGLATSLDVDAVEIRNDLAGNAILDGTSPDAVAKAAREHRLTILSINALQRFNDWSLERKDEAKDLIGYARDCGARALVLVPKNDGTGRADGERQENLRRSLIELKPLLDAAEIIGLVEPLGFEICSLRSKAEAAAVIDALEARSTFRLVHDTFHHHLAGEDRLFAELTGLVHISGVIDPSVSRSDMRDPHRVLVDGEDRLDNLGQIKALLAAGYQGRFSFEPFAAEVHGLEDPSSSLRASMDFLSSSV